jgi:hypothetical protein
MVDITKPTLRSIKFQSNSIAIGDGNYDLGKLLGITVSASDDSSGVSNFYGFWENPNFASNPTGSNLVYIASFLDKAPLSGTSLNGVWPSDMASTLNRVNTPVGTYKFFSLQLRDVAGNVYTYQANDLRNAGIIPSTLDFSVGSYSVVSNSQSGSVNEGSSTSFTIWASNVPLGTSVPYILSGISASDVSGGSLTGNAQVNNGSAYIGLVLENDQLTEGSETLTVTAGGASASILVNDTSITPAPSYSINSNDTVPEYGLISINVVTTNVPSGTPFTFVFSGSGITASDFSGAHANGFPITLIGLSGTTTANSTGVTTIGLSVAGDFLTEGDEVFRVSVGNATSIPITIFDTSKNRAPTYVVASSASSFNEGSIASFTLTTTNVASGTSVPYTLSGISAADVSAGSLSGNAIVNSSGIATISVSLLNDLLTEGSEILTVTAGGASASTIVNDTSQSVVPEIYISSEPNSKTDAVSINEGSNFYVTVFNLNKNIPSYSWTISGVSSSDIGGQLNGTSNTNGGTEIGNAFVVVADNLTEGEETLTINIAGLSKSIKINDTSKSNVPVYYLTSNALSVNEGSSATFTLTTTNVASGTSVPYTLSGISSADVSSRSLSGNAIVNSSGVATISITLLNDALTEGAETLTVSAGNASTSVQVNDTSTSPVVSYSIVANSSNVNEGSSASFTITARNYNTNSYFEYVPYTISGVTVQDLLLNSLSSGVTLSLSQPSQTISIPIYNDGVTEGAETITVTVGGNSASMLINDTSKASTSPTYSVAASNSSFNEGSTVTFILTTTNVAAGTSVWYSFSGISSADVTGGSLGGYATIATNGQATISVLLANDNLTEGAETLTVTTGATSNTNGVSASTQINDTSNSPAPTYSVRTNWTSTTEGTPIVATLSTTNVVAGTTLYYELSGSGITTSDFGGLSLTGSSVINSLGQASLTIPLSADATTEGNETFVIQYYIDSGRSTAAGSAAYVTIQDTSKGAVTPTYAVSANSSSVNEGSTADFIITTSNVSAGTSISYTLSGVSSTDITGGALTGFATVNSSGAAFVSVPIAADSLTEGSETLTISLQGKTASILINDTSKAAAVPTYNLASLSSSVNEGSVASFSLITTSVSPGTSIAYTISGVSSTDVTGGLSGTATVDVNGLASISVPIAADFLTEGAETLTVTAQGKTASVTVNDTSKTTLIASYALSASNNSVSEGSNAVFTLTTTNVAGGTSIPYTISGVSSADITGGALSGTAIVSSNGNATITIPIASDLTTEGTESLTVTAQGISTSVLISDTSITPVVVTPITTVTSIPYGDGKYFYVSAGSDKVTGTSFVDVVKQPSTVSSNQLTKLSDGSWQVQNKITPSNSDNLVNVERVEFSDMSVALDVSGPAGQVAKILGSVFGKSYVGNTEFAGIGFAYLDGGMSYLDLCGLAAGAAGLSTPDLLVTTLLRNTTGTEPTALSKSSYLQSISNGASYASVVQQIADSSANAQSIKLTDLANTGLAFKPYVFPPTYSLSATSNSVNEGSTAVFNLTTTNVAVGTEISYTVSGLSQVDLTSGTLNGKVSIGVGGTASISIPIAADGATEGQESLTISAQGATASIVINDTSKSIALPTYTLTPAALSVNEGELARVYVNTTNVTAGTVLQYGVSGVSANDLIGDLTRLVTVDSLGQAFINIQTIADQITEGPETMYITLGTSTTSFIINDTSVTLVGMIDNGGGGDGGGGGGGGGGAGGGD